MEPTLEQARRVVDAHECATRGHDWCYTFVAGSSYPQQLHCQRDCGAPILKVEQPGESS